MANIRKLLKKIYNGDITSYILGICLFVVAFIALSAVDVITKANEQYKFYNDYKYCKSLDVDLHVNSAESSKAKTGIIQEVFEAEDKVNIEYNNYQTNIGNHLNQYPSTVVVAHNEALHYECDEEYDINEMNGILIGESLLKEVEEDKNGRYLIINNIRRPVIGLLKNKQIAGIDESIILFFDNMQFEAKADVYNDFWGGIFTIKSDDKEAFSEAYNNLLDVCLQNDIELIEREEDDYRGHDNNFTYKSMNEMFMPVCFIFAFITCIFSVYLWLERKEKEIVIRRAYGFDFGQIYAIIIKEISGFITIDLIVLFVQQLIYRIIMDRDYVMMIFPQILFVGIIIFIISSVISFTMLKKYTKKSIIRNFGDIRQ